jgi:hypothetical protein
VDDAGTGFFGDVGVAKNPESSVRLEVSEVVEDRFVGLALEGGAGELVEDGVLLLGLEQRRKSSLHHDVNVAGRFFLNKNASLPSW